LPPDLVEGLKVCAKFASDFVNYSDHNVFVTGDKVLSSDHGFAAMYQLENEVPDDFVLPRHEIEDLNRYDFGGFTKYDLKWYRLDTVDIVKKNRKVIHFKGDNITVSVYQSKVDISVPRRLAALLEEPRRDEREGFELPREMIGTL